MDNRLSLSGTFSQDLLHWRSSRRSKKTCKIETLSLKILKIESSSYQCSRTSIGQRETSERCMSNSERVKNYAERFSRRHWTFLGQGDEKKWYGTQATHLEENGIPSPHRWWNDSKKPVTQYSRASVLWVVEFWKERMAEIPYTSMRIHRTQNSCFAQLTKTAQYRRSSLKLVWRVRSEAESGRVDFGEVRGKRNWSATEKCEAARSEFLGANSKEWWSSIWKQIVRMFSELRNTGEKHTIYKSLRRCIILEKSLQDHCTRRWWFCSWGFRFQNLCRHSRTNYRSSYRTISWHQWNLKFRFPSTATKERTSWVVICQGKTAKWRSYISMIQTKIHKFWIAIGKICFAAESEPCSTGIEETHAKQFKIQTSPVYNYSEEVFLIKRKWNDILASNHFRGNTFEAEVSKLVMRQVRHHDQDERETAGAVHWNFMGPKLWKAFQKGRGQKFSDSDWLQYIYEGSNKTRFQCCKNSKNVSLYIRAVQGHTGANLVAPELMGHVAIPCKWKEFLFHRGSSYDVQSILRSGFIGGGRKSKEGRQTIFFTPLSPFVDNPDEEPSDDLSKQRKVHYHSKWKPRQDAVYWINLARAQEKEQQFWQTRSHAVIGNSTVPSGCIYKVISQRRGKNFICKTLDASSRTEDSTQECLAIAAAAAARHIGECCFGHQETGAKRRNQFPQHPELLSVRKLMRSTESPVEKEAWISSRPQNWKNCTRCDPGRWRENGRNSKSSGEITNEDLEKPGKSMKFSEESSRTIHELGEYWIARAGTDFQNRPVPFFLEAHTGRIDLPALAAFVIDMLRNKCKELKPDSRLWSFFVTLHERITQEVKDTAKVNGKETIGNQWMPEEEQEGSVTTPLWSDGKSTKSTEILSKPLDERKNFADTWTTSRRSTSPAPHPGTRGTGTRTPSHWCALVMIAKPDRCQHEKIWNPQRKFSQVFDKNEDDRFPLFRRTTERGKDHAMKHCEQTWTGRVEIRKPTGRNLPLDHPHHMAGKGDNSLRHYNLVHKFIPMRQAMKIPAAKAAVE